MRERARHSLQFAGVNRPSIRTIDTCNSSHVNSLHWKSPNNFVRIDFRIAGYDHPSALQPGVGFQDLARRETLGETRGTPTEREGCGHYALQECRGKLRLTAKGISASDGERKHFVKGRKP